MSKATTDKSTEQFESLLVAPLRAYGALNLAYAERVVATRFEVASAVSDAALAQARGWLAVQDPDGVRQALEGQRRVVLHLGERLKDDAEALMTLSQEYAQKGRQLAEEHIKAATAR